MTTLEEGMEYVGVKNMWKDEARDFTPWLAAHLHMLRDPLEMELNLVQTEKTVGPFFCDILAKAVDSDARVAIENQLNPTDHNHLGQLLTYAAGLDARIAVWVAPAFFHEHAKVLDWLNTWMGDERKFYGIKVAVLKTDNSLEPRFFPVVTPDGWNDSLSLPQGAADPRKQQFHDFFQPLIDRLCGPYFFDLPVLKFGNNDRTFPSSLDSAIGYRASLEGNDDAWVTLHIQCKDNHVTKRVFDDLMIDRGTIEAQIPDQEWDWRRHNGHIFSSISIRRDGSIDDSPEERTETRNWMLEHLRRFTEIFDQRVADKLTELRANSN